MDPREDTPGPTPPPSPLARRAFIVTGIALAAVAGLVLFWYLVDVLLLAFAGVLVAVILRTPADWVSTRTRLPPGLALTLVVLLLAMVIAVALRIFGQTLTEQVVQLTRTLPETVRALTARLEQYDFWRWLIAEIGPERLLELESAPAFLGRGLAVIQATFGVVAGLVIVFFMGLFLAINPAMYVRGFLHLVPILKRARAHEVLTAMGDTLRWWLLARLFMMVLIGVVTGAGLWLLGAPLPLALGMLAGALELIPFLGPIFAAIPAILIALAQSPTLGVYVIVLYIVVQSVEAYVIDPIVEQRAVYLPPALLLLAQVVLGVLMGFLGILLATPLTAVALVGVKMIYVEDLLGDRMPRA